MTTNLTQYNRDRTALSNAESAQEVMDIAEQYRLMASTYKKAKGYEEEYHKAFELMIEAYWILGKELSGIEKALGGRPSEKETGLDARPVISTLSDLGITKTQSSEWQTISLVPRVEIEAFINGCREKDTHAAKADILRLAEKYKTAKQKTKEYAENVTMRIRSLNVEGIKLIDHLKDFPDSRGGVPKDFHEVLDHLAKLIDELNRRTL